MGPGGELLPTLWQGGEEPTKANTIPDEGHRGCLKQKSAASSRDLESNAAGDGGTCLVGQMSQHRDRRREEQHPLGAVGLVRSTGWNLRVRQQQVTRPEN